MTRLRIFGILVVLALALTGCSIRTAGSPKGDLELTATFEDVNNLVVGHSVKLADVTVGTVTGVELDGYRAQVTMSLRDDLDLPTETTALLSKTSLLGEQYIELRPPTVVPPNAPKLESGDELTDTRATAEFETVTQDAIEFLGAITQEDLSTIVSTGAEAIGGRGDDLNQLLRDLTQVVQDLDDQREEIVATLDGFARLGEEMAAGSDDIVTLVDDLSAASVTLAENRERMLGALSGIRDMTQITNDEVLVPHIDELMAMLRDVDPILATLAGQRPLIESMLESVNQFLIKMAANVNDVTDAQTQYIWARGLATPSGTLGDEPPPSAPEGAPSGPEGGAPAGPAPQDVLGDVAGLVDAILGLLNVDPNVTLAPEVCQQLDDLETRLDPAQALHLRSTTVRVCPDPATSGGTSGGSTGGQAPSSGGTEDPLGGLPIPGVGGG